jgi:hypothetical protein
MDHLVSKAIVDGTTLIPDFAPFHGCKAARQQANKPTRHSDDASHH